MVFYYSTQLIAITNWSKIVPEQQPESNHPGTEAEKRKPFMHDNDVTLYYTNRIGTVPVSKETTQAELKALAGAETFADRERATLDITRGVVYGGVTAADLAGISQETIKAELEALGDLPPLDMKKFPPGDSAIFAGRSNVEQPADEFKERGLEASLGPASGSISDEERKRLFDTSEIQQMYPDHARPLIVLEDVDTAEDVKKLADALKQNPEATLVPPEATLLPTNVQPTLDIHSRLLNVMDLDPFAFGGHESRRTMFSPHVANAVAAGESLPVKFELLDSHSELEEGPSEKATEEFNPRTGERRPLSRNLHEVVDGPRGLAGATLELGMELAAGLAQKKRDLQNEPKGLGGELNYSATPMGQAGMKASLERQLERSGKKMSDLPEIKGVILKSSRPRNPPRVAGLDFTTTQKEKKRLLRQLKKRKAAAIGPKRYLFSLMIKKVKQSLLKIRGGYMLGGRAGNTSKAEHRRLDKLEREFAYMGRFEHWKEMRVIRELAIANGADPNVALAERFDPNFGKA